MKLGSLATCMLAYDTQILKAALQIDVGTGHLQGSSLVRLVKIISQKLDHALENSAISRSRGYSGLKT